MEIYSSSDHPTPTSSSPGTENTYSFNFLHNIPDAMKYITEKLIELRTYLNLAKVNKDLSSDVVDGFKKNTIEATKPVRKLQISVFRSSYKIY